MPDPVPFRPAADATPLAPRLYAVLLAAIALCGAAWRTALAVQMPCVARDGVTWCWLARDLGREGVAALRRPDVQQHPLYAYTLLAVQRGLRATGAAETPLTWQWAGQIASGLSGLAVILLTAWVALRLTRELVAAGWVSGVAPPWAALLAAALAALLPLNVALSADVMSDELHLALYLAALGFMTGMRRPGTAIGSGACAGSAFLTRPEAIVLAGAALATLASRACFGPRRGVLRLGVLWGLGFVVAAGPYWLAIGGLTPKLGKEPVESFVVAVRPVEADAASAAPRAAPRHAALVREEVNLLQAAGLAAYQAVRAGRVVIIPLALPALLVLRRYWLREPLVAWCACLAGHYALCVLLQWRHGYLDPRHALPIIGVLTPLAGLVGAWGLAAARHSPWPRCAAWVTAAAVVGVLGRYALRVPNRDEGFVRLAAEQLTAKDPAVGGKVLLGGGSQRRLAFYADCRFQAWAENSPGAEARWAALRRQMLESRPAYFAIDVGRGRETAGNEVLLERLRASVEIGALLRPVVTVPNEKGASLHVYALDWQAGAAPSKPPAP